MSEAGWLLFGVAAVIVAFALLLLVWRRAFQSVHVKAGPVQMDLAAVKKLDEVHAELKPNGGSSTRDAINRIESTVHDLSRRMNALEDAFTEPPRRHP